MGILRWESLWSGVLYLKDLNTISECQAAARCFVHIVTFSSIYKAGTIITPILWIAKSRFRDRLSDLPASGGVRIHSQAG